MNKKNIIINNEEYIPPFKHIESSIYLDGGTEFVIIEDVNRKRLIFCKDKRLGIKETYKTYNMFWINVIHPSEKNGILIKDKKTELLLENMLEKYRWRG